MKTYIHIKLAKVLFYIALVLIASHAYSEKENPGNLPINFPSAFSLEKEPNRASLTPHLAIIRDPDKTFQVEDILEKIHSGYFRTEEREAVNFGLDRAAQWVAFLIDNPHQKSQEIYIENTFALTDQITLYQIQSKKILNLGIQGDQVPISTRDVVSRQPVFHLNVEPGSNFYIMKLEAENVLQLNLKAWEMAAFHRRNSMELGLIGLLIGFHLVIAFYNLFLYFSFREWMYLTYVCYVFANAIYQAANLGILQLVNLHLFSWETLDNRVMIFWVDAIIISAFYFSDSLLYLKKRLPYMKHLINASLLISFLNIVINLFISTYSAAVICLLNATFAITILVSSGLILCYKRYKSAYYYTIAWGFYLSGASGNVLSLLGVLPASEWNQWSQLFGGAIEVVLLSLVVAYRMSQVQNQLTKYIAEQSQIEKIVVAAQFLPQRNNQSDIPETVQYCFHTQAAHQVGGDWLGMVTHQKDNRVYLFMGDVMGHGLTPAMISVIAAGASRGAIFDSFHGQIPEKLRIENIALAINEALYEKCQEFNTFITMSVLSLNWQTGELWVLNAGHTPILRFTHQKKMLASAPGSLIGMFQTPKFNPKLTLLNPGDTIFLYTDGLTENTDQLGSNIRMKELSKILQEGSDIGIIKGQILELMQQRWQQHEIEDDTTFLILQWSGQGSDIKDAPATLKREA